MSKKIWSGRFSKKINKEALLFNSAENIEIDEKLIKYDIAGSVAHVKMLKKQKILKKNEADMILKALNKTAKDFEAGKFKLNNDLEDVHMNVEAEVTKQTACGEKMHTARSRNDQINLDMRLYMRDEARGIISLLKNAQISLLVQGKDRVEIPAHTHTRAAQPVTNAFWGKAHAVSFGKDIDRLKDLHKRINKNPLGACAIAGTSWNIDKEYTAKLLGFDGAEKHPLEVITSRGELEAEFAFICALISMQLSRIAEDLIWLSYIGMVNLPEEFCTGSSIMPNKVNPDCLELIRGKSGRVYGNLIAILTVLKGTPTGHNADTQETKRAVMDSADSVKSSLDIASKIIKKIKWDKKKAGEYIKNGYAYATILADKLAKSGMPFRKAHKKVGELIKKLQKNGEYLKDLG